MPIDRQLWLEPFKKDPLPFPCPTCGTGWLRYKTQTRGEHVERPLFYVTSPEKALPRYGLLPTTCHVVDRDDSRQGILK